MGFIEVNMSTNEDKNAKTNPPLSKSNQDWLVAQKANKANAARTQQEAKAYADNPNAAPKTDPRIKEMHYNSLNRKFVKSAAGGLAMLSANGRSSEAEKLTKTLQTALKGTPVDPQKAFKSAASKSPVKDIADALHELKKSPKP